jgi:hypothetical protein
MPTSSVPMLESLVLDPLSFPRVSPLLPQRRLVLPLRPIASIASRRSPLNASVALVTEEKKRCSSAGRNAHRVRFHLSPSPACAVSSSDGQLPRRPRQRHAPGGRVPELPLRPKHAPRYKRTLNQSPLSDPPPPTRAVYSQIV